ncbi:MAG: hypothetical protein ABSD38_24085 [Syntrophorhabdales bacterium]|jgi:hypothetical protein
MKKLIAASLLTALVLLAGSSVTLAHAQAPAIDLKSTFISPTPTPGLYVNGWPRFTVHYPKEWVEKRGRPDNVFRATPPGPAPFPYVEVGSGPFPMPLDKYAGVILTFFTTIARCSTQLTTREAVRPVPLHGAHPWPSGGRA